MTTTAEAESPTGAAPAFSPEAVLETLRTLLPGGAVLHEPTFAGKEWDYVKECLDTGWVSSAGKYVDRFETDLAAFTGAPHAIATVNGTAALHLSLLLAGVASGDEVLVPALTFVAPANAIAYCGAVPHFVDSEERTLGVDPAKLADYLADIAQPTPDGCRNRHTGRRLAALVCMHTFGHPVDLDPLVETCARYRIPLIEDAAESLGSTYKGRHTGNFGLLSALSFNGNKVITTGGGGAILTGDAGFAARAKHLSTTAKTPHRWAYIHDQSGYNYRLPNINAALGCAQLEQMPRFIEDKRRLAARYQEAFSTAPGVSVFTEQPFARSNYWLNVLLLDREHAPARDAVLEATNAAGIMTRPAWQLMQELPMYRDCPRMPLACAEDLQARIINIPSSVGLIGS